MLLLSVLTLEPLTRYLLQWTLMPFAVRARARRDEEKEGKDLGRKDTSTTQILLTTQKTLHTTQKVEADLKVEKANN
jgi:hypothetical protein